MKVVDKVWGKEYWIVNDEYCGKFLLLNKGSQSSYHYHNEKKETFYPLRGGVLLTVEGKEIRLGRAYTIEPLVKHSFKGLTDAVILEISTHHDDKDVVRLCPSKA